MAPPDLTVTAGPPLALRHELARKGLHLLTAVLPVGYRLGVPRGVLELILLAAAAIAVVTESVRRTRPARAAAFDRMFGSLTRGHEKRSITGATWLALSCLAAVVFLTRNAAIAALWCATVGDPAATIAGRLWAAARAKHKPETGGKSLVGSLACATASFAGVWLLAGYAPVLAAPVAAAAAAAEAIPIGLDDNVRVAGVAGIVAQFLA